VVCGAKGKTRKPSEIELDEKLVETTEQMVKQVKKVVGVLDKETQEPAVRLVKQAEQMVPLVERVIAQTRKRVLENKKVPSSEKVLSKQSHTHAPFPGDIRWCARRVWTAGSPRARSREG
jgi:hypothetical protein